MYMKSVVRQWKLKEILQLQRSIYSSSGKWPKEFTPEVKRDIEAHWKSRLKIEDVKFKEGDREKSKYYVLSMFPYPSGKLHMGHVRVYTISDVMARYHRLTGKRVIHPMGWDAFGLPAENAAIERGEPPDKWTYSNIENMRCQLEDLCYSFDWSREYATCDPSYYKWTQYIFLKMYEHGLVYQRQGAVNWDPVDQTVLADEQVDENGCSWRSGAKVEKKYLKQWYIRTTAYSKSLLDGLSEVDPELWRDIIDLQRHWIGDCDGVRFEFQTKLGEKTLESPLYIFARHPHCVYGISHVLLNQEHLYNDKQYYKDGYDEHSPVIELTIKGVNPFTQESLPVFISKDFNFSEYSETHLGIPSISETDRNFANKYNLNYNNVLDSNNSIINSEKISGLSSEEALTVITDSAKVLKCGGHVTSEKGRDWLISRQRYWGTPIPMVHCPKKGTMPVPYEDLPVKLPHISQLTGKGTSPLLNEEKWLKVKCPKCDCDGFATRETDTMDTFVDSSWYYLRYTDPHNLTEPFSKQKAHEEMPVDLYIGGKEHAIMHLYYARFSHHFLHDLKLTPTREPFVNLLTQGMVMGKSYRVRDTGKYLRKEDIDFTGSKPVEKSTGAAIIEDWEKMSKSKYNGVDPEEMLAEHGTDSTRLCIIAGVAPKSDRNWSDDVFLGVRRWQVRIWSLVTSLVEQSTTSPPVVTSSEDRKRYEKELFEVRNLTVKEVNRHMSKTFLLSTAISRLQSLTNTLKKIPPDVASESYQFDRCLAELVIMIAPFAPMFASELWHGLSSVPHSCSDFNWEKSVLEQKWPEIDSNYKLKMRVKINNKDGFDVELPMDLEETSKITKPEALELAQACQAYSEHLQGHTPSSAHLFVESNVKVELNLVVKELDKKKTKKKSSKNPSKGQGEKDESIS